MSAKTGRDISCDACGATFYLSAAKIARAQTHYCSPACLAVAARERMEGNRHAVGHRPNRTTFKPGQTPWNKGVAGSIPANAGSYKAGRQNENSLPIGSITVRTDRSGNLRNWYKSERGWIPYAQVVWERGNGPLPEAHIVHHIDENSVNDVPSNLAALTRAEHINVHRQLHKFIGMETADNRLIPNAK